MKFIVKLKLNSSEIQIKGQGEDKRKLKGRDIYYPPMRFGEEEKEKEKEKV